MIRIPLSTFISDMTFPFFAHFGTHEQELYMHSHLDFSELVIVLDGQAEHIVNNESFNIQKGDVFILSNNTEHGYRNVENFKICNIMYRPEFIMSRDYDIFRSSGFQALFILEPKYTKDHHFIQHLRLDENEFNKVYNLISEMIANYDLKETGWQTIVLSDFYRLSVILSRLYRFDTLNDNRQYINLAKAISYIENNYSADFKIKELADLCSYSERQFVRLFRSAYNMTPTDYINSLRLNNACKSLKISNSSITEISIACGFTSSNYFSRIFKKYIGISPTEYRNKYMQ